MITLDEILTPRHQDAIATNMLNRMTPAARAALLQKATPRERRAIEKAAARHSLRQRTRTAWSTEKIRILTAGGTRVAIYPGNHGGWLLEAEGMILTPHGWDADTAPYYWTSQAAAVEALAATI